MKKYSVLDLLVLGRLTKKQWKMPHKPDCGVWGVGIHDISLTAVKTEKID